METRQITQIHVYRLNLNQVRDNYEYVQLKAISTDYQKLVDWYNSQKVEPYRDKADLEVFGCAYHKVFGKGTPLEYYNPCHSLGLNEIDHRGVGISDEWVNQDVFMEILGRYNDFYIISTD